MPYDAKPRHLLPYERWFAALVLRRQATHRTASIRRMEYNYGREGITLFAAALASFYVGAASLIAGFMLMVVSGDPPSRSGLVTFLDLAGLAVMVWAMFRAFQSARAPDAFRDERPYMRSGIPALPPDADSPEHEDRQ